MVLLACSGILRPPGRCRTLHASRIVQVCLGLSLFNGGQEMFRAHAAQTQSEWVSTSACCHKILAQPCHCCSAWGRCEDCKCAQMPDLLHLLHLLHCICKAAKMRGVSFDLFHNVGCVFTSPCRSLIQLRLLQGKVSGRATRPIVSCMQRTQIVAQVSGRGSQAVFPHGCGQDAGAMRKERSLAPLLHTSELLSSTCA